MKAYLANGLFSMGDRMVNERLAFSLRDGLEKLDLYVPQENLSINDKSSYANSKMIANGDDEHLYNSDFMVAVLDGVEIDSGVACEIGVFSTMNKPIFALFTDTRQMGRENQKKIDALIEDATENQFVYRNLYVIGKIKASGGCIFTSVEDLVIEIAKRYS